MSIRSRLVVSYLAIIVLLGGGMYGTFRFFIAGYMARHNSAAVFTAVQNVVSNSYSLSRTILVKNAETIVAKQAEGTAFELAYLLRNTPQPFSYAALRSNAAFRAVATSSITVSNAVIGYMDVFDTNGVAVWHPNPAVEGSNYHQWASEYPAMWALCTQAFTRSFVQGYYSFLDVHSQAARPKFMVAARVTNTPFIVTASIYVDEFYLHVHQLIGENAARELSSVTAALQAIADHSHSIILATSGVALLVLSVVCFLFALRFAHTIVSPISLLQQAVRKIGIGDFSAKVPESGPPEIQHLARVFNSLEFQLRNYMDSLAREVAAREVFEAEVTITRDIQQSLLPRTFPPFPDRKEFDLFAALTPAKEVAGDYYDFFFSNDSTLVFLVGDVSGKSVPAAFFMAVSRTLLRSLCQQFDDPATVLTNANRILEEDNETCMFVTLFLCYYSVDTGSLVYANAGHMPSFVLSPDAPPRTFGLCDDPPLGLVASHQFHSGTNTLAPHETVLLYTDGVTEAHSPENELYGENRFEEFLSNHSRDSVDLLCSNLMSALSVFQHGAVFDDITVLLLKCNTASPASCSGPQGCPVSRLVTITNNLDEIHTLTSVCEAFTEQLGFDSSEQYNLVLVAEEIITNIISYAYADETEHSIEVSLSYDNGLLTVIVTDDGRPFNPLDAPSPDLDASLEDRPIGGLGIALVKSLMDQVSYQRESNRNVLTLVKHIPAPKGL